MKIYIYKDNEISQFPPFQERPWIPKGDNIEEVNSPDDADLIICPAALHRIKSRNMARRIDRALSVGIETLPYWHKYEHKHVFFDCSDFENGYNGTKAILVRCNLRHWMKDDVNSIPWFWPVDNLGEYTDEPEGGIKYDVGFHGWLSTSTRKNCVESCKREFGDKFDQRTFKDFFGHEGEDIQQGKRIAFLKGQQESKILLAPQSIQGVFPYRFYEAMSSQRIPALFCTGYNLPFEDEIDWDKCTLRFDAEQDVNAGKLIKQFLDNTSEEKIKEMAKYGREVWVKWLNRDKQPELMAHALEKKAKELGLI